ncbi:MAG: Hpt domain-containing protein [Pyrinomonadaceae bacterium]
MDKPKLNERRTTAATGVIDLSVLDGLSKLQQPGEPDFVTELIDLFLSEAALQFEFLRVAVANNDLPEVQRLAHLMKGSSANIGATRLTQLCKELEALEGTTTAELTLLLKFEDEFRAVAEALKNQRLET